MKWQILLMNLLRMPYVISIIESYPYKDIAIVYSRKAHLRGKGGHQHQKYGVILHNKFTVDKTFIKLFSVQRPT